MENIENVSRMEWKQVQFKVFNNSAMKWIFVSPQNSYWNLILNMMVFGGRAFGKWLGYEDVALMNEIGALIKEALQRSLTMWSNQKYTQATI